MKPIKEDRRRVRNGLLDIIQTLKAKKVLKAGESSAI